METSRSRPLNAATKLALAGWVAALMSAVLLAESLMGPRPLLDPSAAPRPVAARGDLAQDEQATIRLFDENARSVVHISTAGVVQDRWSYRTFEVPRGTGSGFVWDSEGLVVTNAHVIQGASRAVVTLADGASYPARLVGQDPANDLAVLRIDAPDGNLRPLPLGTSADLRVGQKVFAIGNPYGFDWTLTTGIVSGLDRQITSREGNSIFGVIQTDAAINPGNSGGPLLDSAGRLIGVNTAIYSPSGSSAGIGFAVPVDTVNRIVPEIVATGEPPRVGLGIVMAPDAIARRAGIRGVIVSEVLEGSGAARAGLRAPEEVEGGVRVDVIVGVEDRPVRGREDLLRTIGGRRPGDRVTLQVVRGGERRELEVELGVLR